MNIGRLDFDPRPEYLIIYRDKEDDTINTWTLPEGSFQLNYESMKDSGKVEFLGVYRKLSDKKLSKILTK